jgi:hypothetical protein
MFSWELVLATSYDECSSVLTATDEENLLTVSYKVSGQK